MKILAKLPNSVKKVVKVILFPGVLLWMALAYVLYKIAQGLDAVADWMTDGRIHEMD